MAVKGLGQTIEAFNPPREASEPDAWSLSWFRPSNGPSITFRGNDLEGKHPGHDRAKRTWTRPVRAIRQPLRAGEVAGIFRTSANSFDSFLRSDPRCCPLVPRKGVGG